MTIYKIKKRHICEIDPISKYQGECIPKQDWIEHLNSYYPNSASIKPTGMLNFDCMQKINFDKIGCIFTPQDMKLHCATSQFLGQAKSQLSNCFSKDSFNKSEMRAYLNEIDPPTGFFKNV